MPGTSIEQAARAYYRTGHYLKAKHERVRFDSGRQFQRWALDRVGVLFDWRVLDAGCGWGRFTWALVDNYHVSPKNVVAVDLSPGMLWTVRDDAHRRGCLVQLCNASIDALPLEANSFDLAIAAHVLYHLPDLDLGLRELARVIKPGGKLLVTTNADSVNPLVLEVHYRALQTLGIPFDPPAPSTFSMENGADHLARVFGRVDTHWFVDTTTWLSVSEFVDDYVTIGRYRSIVEDESIDLDKRQGLAEEVRRLATEIFARDRALRSPALVGAFVASVA